MTVRSTLLRLFGVLALLAAAVRGIAATMPSVPVSKTFADWLVACDNTRRCEVKFLPDADAVDTKAANDTTLAITRDAGSEGPLALQVYGQHEGIPAALMLDKQALGSPGLWQDAGNDGAILHGPAALALVRRLRDGAVLAMSLPDGESRFSLRGLAAALLLVDAVQGRADGVTALARPGPTGADAVPPAPALPVLHAAPAAPPLRGGDALVAAVRRAQRGLLKAQDCDEDAGSEGDGDQAWPLDAATALVALRCIQGAYQGSSLMLRVSRDAVARAELLHLPPPPGYPGTWDHTQDDQLTEVDYDPDTATLATVSKGRGLADCGLSASWVFDGRTFRPAALAFQGTCGGEAGDWPTLFRTRTAPIVPK